MESKKRLLISVLSLVLVASALLCACTPKDAYDSDNNIDTENTSDSTADTSETPETTEAKDDLEDEKLAIKAQVLAIMAEDDRQDPMRLFDYFMGDYSIGNIFQTNDYSATISKIWQKDGVCVIEYRDGHKEYSLVRNGYVFRLTEQGGNTDVISATPFENANRHIPSIFDDFGIDITAIYSKDDGNDVPDPTLTEDMLTVSDDLSTCEFSAAYMQEVTDMLLDTMGLNDAQQAEFKKEGSATGVYTVAEKTVVFTIKGKHATLGDMTITVTHATLENNEYSLSQKLEYTVISNGISIPTSNELIIRSAKYNGNEIVSADFESRVIETGAQITQNGVTYVMDGANITRIYLDKQTNTLQYIQEQQATTSFMGQSQNQSASVYLDVTKGNFNYLLTQNGTALSQINGSNTEFTAPDGATIPQIVFELADKAYYDVVG